MKRGFALFTLLVLAGALSGCQHFAGDDVQRYGWVTMVKPEKLDYYKELHANPWPGVIAQLKQSNIRNYSIFVGELTPGEFYLFSYLEYTGDDFEADMARIAEDETTQRWWKETDPCQQPVPMHEGEGPWMDMESVFFME